MALRILRAGMYGLGLVVAVALLQAQLHAQEPVAPEIDGGSITAGLALLTSSILMLGSRRRSK